jgi:hypothetical protein
MPKIILKNNINYISLYIFFLILELMYIILILSPYSEKILFNIKYIDFIFIFLIFFNILFPGIGWLAFFITIYKKKIEYLTDYTYCTDYKYFTKNATIYNEALLERIDNTTSGYSSAQGDVQDKYYFQIPTNLKKNKEIFEILNTPRGLYTTSLLAKEMQIS